MQVTTRTAGWVHAAGIEKASWTGRRSGRFVGFGGTVKSLRAGTRAGPLYHASLDEGFVMFSPLYELIGMKGIRSTLKPETFSKPVNSVFSSVKRFSEYSGFVASILLIATMSCSTPRTFAR